MRTAGVSAGGGVVACNAAGARWWSVLSRTCMRRAVCVGVWVRGHENVRKRVLIQAAACNIGLLLRRLTGVGTPRSLQGRAVSAICRLIGRFAGGKDGRWHIGYGSLVIRERAHTRMHPGRGTDPRAPAARTTPGRTRTRPEMDLPVRPRTDTGRPVPVRRTADLPVGRTLPEGRPRDKSATPCCTRSRTRCPEPAAAGRPRRPPRAADSAGPGADCRLRSRQPTRRPDLQSTSGTHVVIYPGPHERRPASGTSGPAGLL